MQYQWLIFDADGTLFDYDRAEETALRLTFESFGISFEPHHRAVYRRINQQLWVELEQERVTSSILRVARFERLFSELGIVGSAIDFNEKYLVHLANAAELMDGALEVVQRLYQHYQLAIITNGIKQVQEQRLARSPLKDYFPVFVISEVVGAAKPHPKIFDAAFRAMGNPAKESVLLIGDSLTSDIQGGFNYGIDTCWFNPAHAPRAIAVPCKYEIGRLDELLNIL